MKIFGKIPNKKKFVFFTLDRVEYPIRFFCETVTLNSPGHVESGDFFLRILNSLAFWENAGIDNKYIRRMRGMKLSTLGENYLRTERICRIRRIYSGWLNKNSSPNMAISAFGECADRN
jgi:hypothetical protein